MCSVVKCINVKSNGMQSKVHAERLDDDSFSNFPSLIGLIIINIIHVPSKKSLNGQVIK